MGGQDRLDLRTGRQRYDVQLPGLAPRRAEQQRPHALHGSGELRTTDCRAQVLPLYELPDARGRLCERKSAPEEAARVPAERRVWLRTNESGLTSDRVADT